MKKILSCLLALLLVFSLAGCLWEQGTPPTTQSTTTEATLSREPTAATETTAPPETTAATQPETPPQTEPENSPALDPDGSYKSKDEVALYIHLYGKLPANYITKSAAKRQYGSTSKLPKTMNIGGDRFYNREGLLPAGHTYYECDIATSGGSSRGAKRIVFSDDGLIFYTANHYASFTQLY